MAPFVPLVDGAQAELGFRLGGIVCTNRLWFIKDNPPVVLSDLDGLVTGLISWYTSSILPFLSDELTFRGARATDWGSSPGGTSSITVTSVLGGVASKTYSANVAVVVPFRWPSSHWFLKRNKHYVPGIPDSAIAGNDVDSTFSANLFEGYAALIDAARLFPPILNWRWMVTSAWEGGSLRSEQFARECIGPPPDTLFVIGQRRARLR